MSDVATLQVAGTAHPPVDHAKWFIPEHFTPLFYTPIYAGLSEAVRLRYNQLHALNINEQFMFLEDALAANVIGALLRHPLITPPLANELREFIAEEARHTELFRQTNRLCAPQLYADRSARGKQVVSGLHGGVTGCDRLLWLRCFAAVPHHKSTRDSASRDSRRSTTCAGLNGRLRSVGSMILKSATPDANRGWSFLKQFLLKKRHRFFPIANFREKSPS